MGHFESVVSDFKDKHNGSDFSHPVKEVQESMANGTFSWKELDRLNKDVDFGRKGFPEDFTIVDASGPVVVTLSEDFKKSQVRESGTLKLVNEWSNSADQIESYKKSLPLVAAASGATNEIYTVAKGDNLYDISKQALEHAWDRKPTPQEITEHWKQIAKINELKDPNRINPGDELKMPPIKSEVSAAPKDGLVLPESDKTKTQKGSTETAPGTETTPSKGSDTHEGLSVEAPILRPVGDVFKPAASLGVLSDETKIDGLEGETTVVVNSDNSMTRKFVGEMDDDLGIFSTTVNSQLEIDEEGNIKSSMVTYDGSGVTIEFDCGDGNTKSILTKSVITTFDKESGRFVTEINSSFPQQQFLAYTDTSGVVTLFKQVR